MDFQLVIINGVVPTKQCRSIISIGYISWLLAAHGKKIRWVQSKKVGYCQTCIALQGLPEKEVMIWKIVEDRGKIRWHGFVPQGNANFLKGERIYFFVDVNTLKER